MLSSTILAEIMQCWEGRKYRSIQNSFLGQPAMLMRVQSLIFGVYFCVWLQTSLGNDNGGRDSVNIRFQPLSMWQIKHFLQPPCNLQIFNENSNLSDKNNIIYVSKNIHEYKAENSAHLYLMNRNKCSHKNLDFNFLIDSGSQKNVDTKIHQIRPHFIQTFILWK
jgi:hypothetical protein